MNQTLPSLFLRDKDKTALLHLLELYVPEVSAWAYGSRVKGQAHEASDLDLVLRSADLSPIPIEKMARLREALSESNIPILVDVKDWARLPESFHDEILKLHVILKR
jgi:predicted nucleotidyltransferase